MHATSVGNEGYRLDNQAGPVFGFTPISNVDAEQLATRREEPHIITFVVWPYPEASDPRPVRRTYYALNLPQAVARATEIEIRLREQGLRALLASLRPATDAETNVFFRVMDIVEARSSDPVTDCDLAKGRRSLFRTTTGGPKLVDGQVVKETDEPPRIDK